MTAKDATSQRDNMNSDNEPREHLLAEVSRLRREIEELSYAVSHDLKAPLRTVSGFTQLLSRKYRDKLDGQALDYLQRVNSGVSKLEGMVDALLQLSRTGRAELVRAPVDVSAVVRELVDELRKGDQERSVAVEVEVGESTVADAALLRSALRNLLDNAWKFTSTRPDARIRVYSKYRDGVRWFCVADNGAGFASAQVDRLFRPFQRLHLESEFPGLGMGLAIVRKIVERHGGRVSAEGEENAGATFCFTLGDVPVSPGPAG